MSAPGSSPDLSVVSESSDSRASSSGTPARPTAAPEPSRPAEAERHGAPWWLLIVVAVVGVLFFLHQYQRAEGLDARVASLTEELLAADQQLEEANRQIASHQSHLQRVRAGIAALSDQVVGLQALADRDPLAPLTAPDTAAEVAPEAALDRAPAAAAAADAGASAAEPAPPEPSRAEGAVAGGETSGGAAPLTDAEGYYWRAEGAGTTSPSEPEAAERQFLIESATGTSFADR
ncbi:MAG TPA: hypothetical protein ENO23_07460 [Alphaproteobacteria bacterium]|nr:hypothetical protein [Alphaproteobacteria bacterium]